MKKLFASLSVCLLCLMLPVMARALTQKEWNQQCRLKTNGSVMTYSTQKSDSTTGNLATGTDIDMWESGSLPAGTYIKISSYDSQLNMWEISFFKGNSVASAFIREYRIVAAVASVKIDDGTTIDVPEALLEDKAALFRYLSAEMPGYTFSEIEGSSVIHKEKSNGEGTGSGLSDWERLQLAAERAAKALNLDENGLPRALVYAPRTGQASLRDKPSGKGKVIEKYKDGTIVSVVEVGDKFTQVLVDGKAGYIINSALEMLDIEQRPIGLGVLHYKGKTTGRNQINLRCDAGSKARRIDTWPTGTDVIVWTVSEDEKWYEVQANGMRLYVEAQYLEITEIFKYDDEDAEAEEESVDADEETPAATGTNG